MDFKRSSFACPDLAILRSYEWLISAAKNKYLSPETIWQSLELALELPIHLVNEANLHQRAREIAMQYNLPATYDAHYLALAEWMDIELWTADMRLVNTLKPFKLDWVKGI
jgi:predicted nucleic acid-binding protein